MINFKLLLISLSFDIVWSISCPLNCTCTNDKVDCSRKQLLTLPPLDNISNKVTELIFKENYLTSINTSGQFPFLIKLDFSKNAINYIKPDAFANLTNLEYLNLSRNRLSNLSSEVFAQVNMLKALDLSDNHFETFPDTIFANKLWLEELILSNNPLKTIDVYWFVSLPRLRTLSISSTNTYTLDDVTFRYNQHLETIDLSNNQFTSVPTSALRMLSNLKSLKFDANPIRILNYQAFEKLSNLETLTLNRMPRLTLIENFVFSDLHKLQRLEITYNPILVYIDSEAFLDIDVNLTRFPIEVLLLNNNDLKTLSEFTLPWCKIPKVDLRDNDWNCNCELKWIKDCKDNEDFKSVKCSKPELLSGIEIGVININDFKCKTSESEHNKVIQVYIMLFGVIILFFIGLSIALYLQRQHFLRWFRDRRRGPGSIYYVKVAKNTRNEDSI